jgi:hypothetical protein
MLIKLFLRSACNRQSASEGEKVVQWRKTNEQEDQCVSYVTDFVA